MLFCLLLLFVFAMFDFGIWLYLVLFVCCGDWWFTSIVFEVFTTLIVL